MQKKTGTADTKIFKAATTPGAEIEHPRISLPLPQAETQTLLGRAQLWFTKCQGSHCGITPVELAGNLPSRVWGKLYRGRCLMEAVRCKTTQKERCQKQPVAPRCCPALQDPGAGETPQSAGASQARQLAGRVLPSCKFCPTPCTDKANDEAAGKGN